MNEKIPTSAAPGVLLRAVGLKKKYGKTLAADGISLESAGGQVIGVIGPNGAGKSTLLYLLGGIVMPTSGHVSVFGMHRWEKNFEIRKRSVFVPAEPAFGSEKTPYGYLRFFAQIYGIPKKAFLEKAERLVAEMNMTEHLDKQWMNLSLGMQKKVGLIAAFLPEVEFRILDEPFAGGIDPIGMERLYRWMVEGRERGELIVFSTQVLEQAGDIADRIVLLNKGALVLDASPAELIRKAGFDPNESRALAKAFIKLTGEKKPSE